MRVFEFNRISSTSLFLKELKEKRDYDIAIAKVQTLGRGRRGNKWDSEEGGAYFSFVLKEDKNICPKIYEKLSLVAGYSLLKSLEELEPSLKFFFKWTNDIYLQDRKLSGILIEKKDDYFIIGIGVNLNNEISGGFKKVGIALRDATLKEYNIKEVITLILENFKKDLAFYFNGNFKKILEELNKKNYLDGKDIIVEFGSKECIEGKARSIHETGQLIVEVEGKEELFNIGEIHIVNRKMQKNLQK